MSLLQQYFSGTMASMFTHGALSSSVFLFVAGEKLYIRRMLGEETPIPGE
jgi:hypothetical protein